MDKNEFDFRPQNGIVFFGILSYLGQNVLPIALDWQNNNIALASRFFVHFFSFVARLKRENA